ncbi:NUDIX hydrolase [Ornithinibacillus halotolerans]|uniref:7,8-dihydro-8-oxoguanine triphosphatase n=1 Tax=Ornithinibacillus halotolerans TaxID=1274357 RepID=A0A916S2Z9_9BACI|nr:8-oxo-dGTP diphosphatase [Ornithinibacillus halotolerans]GGA80897.1 7,8-dihydro-8-oxoguanine triphosphatase [Ornithinibacillus halotolerans]
MLTYTIGFIKRADEILLLNRESPSWMGSWNGVGGKIEKGETPLESITREVFEETGISLHSMQYKGKVTWVSTSGDYNGMYAFIGELPDAYELETPIKTVEGILDWKKLDWIFHSENTGVANLHYYLPIMLREEDIYEHHFVYKNKQVDYFERREIDRKVSVF